MVFDIIYVGLLNLVKINVVFNIFFDILEYDFDVQGMVVLSGVFDQLMNEDEMCLGVINCVKVMFVYY